MDLLVLAAFAPELDPLRGALRARAEAHTVGVGLAAAAAAAGALIASRSPRAVLLVGSCGAYMKQPGLAIGDAVTARAVKLVEPAVAAGDAFFPSIMVTGYATDADLCAGLESAGAAPAVVGNTLAITRAATLAADLAALSGCDVEHLEAFGVAAACAGAGVPFACVLGVANAVGPSAHEEWRANARAAHESAARVVAAWLSAGAPGLRGS